MTPESQTLALQRIALEIAKLESECREIGADVVAYLLALAKDEVDRPQRFPPAV